MHSPKPLDIFRKIEVAFNHWQNINLIKNTKNCIKQNQPHYVSPCFFLNSIPCFPKTRRQKKSVSMSSGRQRLLSIGRVKNTGINDEFILSDTLYMLTFPHNLLCFFEHFCYFKIFIQMYNTHTHS